MKFFENASSENKENKIVKRQSILNNNYVIWRYLDFTYELEYALWYMHVTKAPF